MDISGAIDGLCGMAESRIARREGDYVGEDGLLYCGRCRSAKECVVDFLGKTRKVRCLCRCENDRLESEREESRRNDAVRALRERCFDSSEFERQTFRSDDGKNASITGVAENYVKNFDLFRRDGRGLFLYGPVGSGKTFAAACIANELMTSRLISAKMTNFARIANLMQSGFDRREPVVSELMDYDLLIIDDLFAERDTSYMDEIVFQVIDRRCRCRRPLIVTSNVTDAELKGALPVERQRIVSRLYELCVPVRVEGDDRRKEKLRHDYGEYNGLLGIKQ